VPLPLQLLANHDVHPGLALGTLVAVLLAVCLWPLTLLTLPQNPRASTMTSIARTVTPTEGPWIFQQRRPGAERDRDGHYTPIVSVEGRFPTQEACQQVLLRWADYLIAATPAQYLTAARTARQSELDDHLSWVPSPGVWGVVSREPLGAGGHVEGVSRQSRCV
jgi:hypothetical protein